MGDRWEKQSRKPEQVEDNAKALGVSLEEADIVQMKKDIETLLQDMKWRKPYEACTYWNRKDC